MKKKEKKTRKKIYLQSKYGICYRVNDTVYRHGSCHLLCTQHNAHAHYNERPTGSLYLFT